MNVKPMMQVWSEQARNCPDDPALTVGRHPSVSWRELNSRSNRIARLLADRGVTPNSLVTIARPMSEFAVLSLLAVLKLGATPNPVSASLPQREREELLQLAQPSAVIAEDDAGFPGHACIVSETEAAGYDDSDLPLVVAPSYKAPTSGGSTGRPKIILSGQPAEIATAPVEGAGGANAVLPFDSVALFAGPLYHNTATQCTLTCLSQRTHVVVEERFDPELSLELIERHRVTFTLLVPTMMNRIWNLGAAIRAKYDLSSLDIVLHNAAACPEHLKRNWLDWLGAERVWENYAATEFTAQTLASGTEWLERPGTVGRVSVGEIEIRDESGTRLPSNEVGVIWMRRPEGTPRTFTYIGEDSPDRADRWETVGDMGYMDDAGYLFLADRRKDMIISGGANIYPAEVEAAVNAHPSIVDSVVIGLPDDDMGQLTHAIVQLTDAFSSPDIGDLNDFVRERLVGYKCPRSYEFVTEPLRNDAGKTRRSALTDERARNGCPNRIPVKR